MSGNDANDEPDRTEAAGESRPAPRRASLLERASNAFGLDSLSPPPAPRFTDDAAGRLNARRVDPLAATGLTYPSGSTPAPMQGTGAASQTGIAPTPAPRASGTPAVRFHGAPQKVDRSLLREQGLIDPDGGTSALLEEFRIVKRQLLATAKAEGTPGARRILVCSPHPDEGKTFCALNLALALAGDRDNEVVLVDGDFAKPSIPARLGIEVGKGLMDVLSDTAAFIEDYVVTTDVPGLHILGAGTRTGRDAEYLASERTSAVLGRLTEGAPNRFVVFDSPPALAASPAAELAKHAGQALLVARADVTGQPALEDAVDLLSACPDIKLLLNDATFSLSGRRFGSYYGYGD